MKRKKRSHEGALQEGDGFVELTLMPGQAAVFTGMADLEVKSGCLEVAGFVATAASGTVALTASSRPGGALLLTAVAKAQATQVPHALQQQHTLAVLHHHRPGQCQPGAPSASDALDSGGACPSSFQLSLAGGDPPARPHEVSAEWQQAVSRVCEYASAAGAAGTPPPVVVVCGAKGVGKSTFCRYLVNALLSGGAAAAAGSACPAVAYMDTDCGQPEFTPPGLVSLHLLRRPVIGPPHVHQQTPRIAFFQGDVSPRSDPNLYLRSVRALFDHQCAQGGGGAAAAAGVWPPLVINTHGWVSGLGLDLLVELLRYVAPTHVITLQSSASKRNLPDGAFWLDQTAQQLQQPVQLLRLSGVNAAAGACAAGGAAGSAPGGAAGAAGGAAGGAASGAAVSTRGASLDGPPPSTASWLTGDAATGGRAGGTKVLSAVESRALLWLCWARRVRGLGAAQGSDADAFAEAAAGLAAQPPYEARLRDVRLQLLHTHVPPQQAAYAVNGALVGLVCAPGVAEAGGGALAAPPPCVGVGLVRAVDASRGVLYLLTDVAEAQLQSVAELQVGLLELPPQLAQCGPLVPPYDSLFCLAAAATGAGKMKSRNNLLRASLLGQT